MAVLNYIPEEKFQEAAQTGQGKVLTSAVRKPVAKTRHFIFLDKKKRTNLCEIVFDPAVKMFVLMSFFFTLAIWAKNKISFFLERFPKIRKKKTLTPHFFLRNKI